MAEVEEPTISDCFAVCAYSAFRMYPSIIPNPADLPITGINPLGGELRWYLDAAAVPI